MVSRDYSSKKDSPTFDLLYKEHVVLESRVKQIEAGLVRSNHSLNHLVQRVDEIVEAHNNLAAKTERLVRQIEIQEEAKRVAVIQEITGTDKSYKVITIIISALSLIVILVAIILAIFLKR